MYDIYLNGSYEDFEKFNEEYSEGKYRGSEARPYNLDNIRKWIEIRDNYKLLTDIDDINEADWEYIDIKQSHSKYGDNYVYVNRKTKQWRLRQTANEFYGGSAKKFEF